MKIKFSKKKTILFLVTVILIFLISIKIFRNTNNTQNDIFTDEVKMGSISLMDEFEGEVRSDKEVLIFSNFNSKVKKVNFRVGDIVKKGDILAVLDISSLDDIKENINKIKMDNEIKQKEYKNALSLYQIGGISKNELLKLENILKLSNMELNKALKDASEFSENVLSTVSGVITESYVDENLKVDSSRYLYKIIDVENLKINVEVPNSKINNIKIGNDVVISSDSLGKDVNLKSKVSKISKISKKSPKYNDIVTDVEINLENNSFLRPNEILNVKIIYEDIKDVMVVKFTDIIFEDNKSYVYIIDKDGIVRKNEVILGKTDNEFYEIKKGLNLGDEVLNNNLKRYKEGEKIR